jgi:hypothetical protein
MGSAKTMLSAEQFLRLPPQEGKRCELSEGELVEPDLLPGFSIVVSELLR